MTRILICLLLMSCAAPAAVPPPEPVAVAEPVVPDAPAPVPVGVPHAAAVAVTHDYSVARRKELDAVIAPQATPASIKRLHEADVAALAAVQVLEKQGAHPTADALRAARGAVGELQRALDAETPQ